MKPISAFENMPVYTRRGAFVGYVKNAILDLDQARVDALVLTRTNADLVEKGLDVAVPYRWVGHMDDILVLTYFPTKVKAPVAAEATVAPAA